MVEESQEKEEKIKNKKVVSHIKKYIKEKALRLTQIL